MATVRHVYTTPPPIIDTAKGFAETRHIPETSDVLINGNSRFHDMIRRQDQLVGQALDACVILHVYEELKRGTHPQQLDFFLHGISEQEKTALLQGNSETRLNFLVDLCHNGTKDRFLTSHRHLTTGDEWEDFKKERAQYLANTRWDMPEDPRIKAINDDIKPTIQLASPGAKSLKSILSKQARRHSEDTVYIRDANRLAVQPVLPAYARDLGKVLRLLNPPIVLPPSNGNSSRILPSVFEELPEMFPNGYYCQKYLIASGRLKDRPGDMEPEIAEDGRPMATISELKVVPPQMWHHADRLSATTKPLLESLAVNKAYVWDEQKRKELRTEYQAKQLKFQALVSAEMARETDMNELFPDFPKQNLNRPETYTKLFDNLMKLTQNVHFAAVHREDPQWQRELVMTGIFHILCSEDNAFRKHAEQVLGQRITDEPNQKIITPPREMLAGIAETNGWSFELLTRQVKEKYSRVHSNRNDPVHYK